MRSGNFFFRFFCDAGQRVWNFNDALLGNLSTDRKNGAQSGSGASANVIINGSAGYASQLKFNNGTTVTTNTAANAFVQGVDLAEWVYTEYDACDGGEQYIWDGEGVCGDGGRMAGMK